MATRRFREALAVSASIVRGGGRYDLNPLNRTQQLDAELLKPSITGVGLKDLFSDRCTQHGTGSRLPSTRGRKTLARNHRRLPTSVCDAKTSIRMGQVGLSDLTRALP